MAPKIARSPATLRALSALCEPNLSGTTQGICADAQSVLLRRASSWARLVSCDSGHDADSELLTRLPSRRHIGAGERSVAT